MAEDKIKALYGNNATSKRFDELMKDDRSAVIAGLLRLTPKTISKLTVSYSSCSCKL